MSAGGDFGNPLRKFKLVFLGEQSGKYPAYSLGLAPSRPPPPHHPPRWGPGPGSEKPLQTRVEGRDGDGRAGPGSGGARPGWGPEEGWRGRWARGGGEGGRWGAGLELRGRRRAAGRPEGGGSLSRAGRGVKAPGSPARSQCGTGCGRPRRWPGAGGGRGRTGAPPRRTRRGRRLAGGLPADPAGTHV